MQSCALGSITNNDVVERTLAEYADSPRRSNLQIDRTQRGSDNLVRPLTLVTRLPLGLKELGMPVDWIALTH